MLVWTGGQVADLALPSLSDVDARSNNKLRQVKVVHQVLWTLDTGNWILYSTLVYCTALLAIDTVLL